jgi:hypothetical protein
MPESPPIVLDIPETTPSMNVMLGQHWSKKHKLAKHWHQQVWAAVKGAYPGRMFTAPPFAIVTIERYAPRVLDPDNFKAGCKALVDGLKQQKLIFDDSEQYMKGIYVQRFSKVRRMVVTVEVR